ncbi:MAG: SigE family RNA polymerase sigma factor [Nocardioidaceae bacterium]|nr:SigE family RNA polymerase sigma factor [Nocardioidaceae bacterium]
MTADEEFTEFVTTAWPVLFRTAHLLVGERGLAEDLVQTALAKTYLSWGRIRDRGAAGVYARTVLINTATSWFRRHAWRREVATGELPDRVAPATSPDRPDLAAALRALPPRQRAVVVLRFYEDLSVEQTAQALRITPGTVKSQTSHALAKLRTELGETFQLEGVRHD